jgi:hypothetical protein
MKVVYSVSYSVDSSARGKIRSDITKIFEIKKLQIKDLQLSSRLACTIFELFSD